MSEKVEIQDLPKVMTGNVVRANKIVLCDRCLGFGFVETEEEEDYHKRTYSHYRTTCKKCEGDGRLIEVTEDVTMHNPRSKLEKIPYITFKDSVDPHFNDSRWFRMRLDMSDTNLERKYPELAAVNYDNYDRLVEQYRLIEILKKEENNG